MDKALELTLEAEKLLNSLREKSSSDLSSKRADILYQKSWIYYKKNEYEKALETALCCLEWREKIGNKLNIAYSMRQLSSISLFTKINAALDYAMKSLTLQTEINNQIGIASSLQSIGATYIIKGNFDEAIKFYEQSLSVKEIGNDSKLEVIFGLGNIALKRGELDRALKYLKQGCSLAEEVDNEIQLARNLVFLGYVYMIKGENDQAKEYLERSLTLSEKKKFHLGITASFSWLIQICLAKNLDEQAKLYLTRYKRFVEQIEQKDAVYLYTKAMFLKKRGRTRDRAKAEQLFKKIIELESSLNSLVFIGALFYLCKLFLEELEINDDPEILDEINPLITQLLNLAEKEQSYWWLACAKLLQAKLALIQIDIPKTQELLTQTQDIAESHGLPLMARTASKEHDNLLGQLHLWNALKKRKAPMSERIKLASFDKFIDQFKENRVVKPPELIDEIPVLLLIIAEGGTTAFSNYFTEELSFEDEFISNFLTAFNTFSEEVFSKGLDRAKFGDYMLVMESVGPFSVCYLFKGQSYVAKQKLIQFAHLVQNNSLIWKAFENFHKTHQTVILTENPSLETLITEIFIKKSPEISTPL
jgi:tetratricopeptide (TPR) repeat protein